MQDQSQTLNVGARVWLSKRLPLIIAGYFASVFVAALMVPSFMLVSAAIPYVFGQSGAPSSGDGVSAVFGVMLISVIIIAQTTILQFIITVTISEIRCIRTPIFYAIMGVLTALTAWMMLINSAIERNLMERSWFVILLALFGSASGYVYWLIAVRNVRKADVSTPPGFGVRVFYSYLIALYTANLASSIFAAVMYWVYVGNVNGAGDGSLMLFALPFTTVLATIMGILFTGVQFLIFVYASEKFALKALWHHIAAGIAIALSIYFYDFTTSPPLPLNPPEWLAAMRTVNFIASVATGAIGGAVYWWLSWLREEKKS